MRALCLGAVSTTFSHNSGLTCSLFVCVSVLQGEAFAFRREAKRARRVMWWKVRGLRS
jgi:hypothetical protein